MEEKKRRGRPPKGQEIAKSFKERCKPITNMIVTDAGIPCNHCGNRYDHSITNTYANGNRRRLCGKCKKPFVTVRVKETL